MMRAEAGTDMSGRGGSEMAGLWRAGRGREGGWNGDGNGNGEGRGSWARDGRRGLGRAQWRAVSNGDDVM